jgi:hypothetical protein
MVNYFLKSFDLMHDNVDKLVDIMRIKVDEVLERDQKLSQLDDRAGKIYIF